MHRMRCQSGSMINRPDCPHGFGSWYCSHSSFYLIKLCPPRLSFAAIALFPAHCPLLFQLGDFAGVLWVWGKQPWRGTAAWTDTITHKTEEIKICFNTRRYFTDAMLTTRVLIHISLYWGGGWKVKVKLNKSFKSKYFSILLENFQNLSKPQYWPYLEQKFNNKKSEVEGPFF